MALCIKASLCYMLVLCFRRINTYKNCGCVKAAKLVQTGKSIWSGVFCTINSLEFVSIFLHQYYESCFQGFITPIKTSGWNLVHQMNYSFVLFLLKEFCAVSNKLSDTGNASAFLFTKQLLVVKGINRLPFCCIDGGLCSQDLKGQKYWLKDWNITDKMYQSPCVKTEKVVYEVWLQSCSDRSEIGSGSCDF